MRTLLSKFFYHIGNAISKLLYFNCFSWLYPIYNKLMLKSARLDREGYVWRYTNQIAPKLSEKQKKILLKELKKRKLHNDPSRKD